MSEMTAHIAYAPSSASDLTARRDQALAQVIGSGELAWLIEERYEAPTSSWVVSIARQGDQARWMRQRYRYDSAVDVLFFLGERPLNGEELSLARRNGRLIN